MSVQPASQLAAISIARRDPAELANALLHSHDKLFFVAYAPTGTLCMHWYLVCLDFDACARVSRAKDHAATGHYVVDFFAKFSRDRYQSDPDSRWWPEWQEFSFGSNGEMELGARIEFAPNRRPDLDRFTTYSDVLDLCNPDVCLVGPFDFADAPSRKSRDSVPLAEWHRLRDAVQGREIVAPMLQTPLQPRRSNRHRALALLLYPVASPCGR